MHRIPYIPHTILTVSRLTEKKFSTKPVPLKSSDTLKVILTTQEGNTARRPHQAFLLLREEDTGLDTSYPFNVKDSGKAKIELVWSSGPIIGIFS